MSNNLVVLLSAYNGEAYIKEQLNSLENQTYKNFNLIVRDDGSTDNTIAIIKEFIAKSSLHVSLHNDRKNLGAMRSFEALLGYSLEDKQYQYFMFCDQDDVWFEDKIKLSLKTVKRLNPSKPHLLYSDLQVVDETLNILAPSFWKYFNLNPSLNELNRLAMQCNVTGCTMIFNHSLATLSLPFRDKTVMHDHWLGLVATSMGEITYLQKATLSYRQHGANISGGAEHFGVRYIIKKASKYFSADEFEAVLGRQIEQANAFLVQYKAKLTKQQIQTLEALISLKTVSFVKRIFLIFRYKLYKQGFLRNIGLFLWLTKISFGTEK